MLGQFLQPPLDDVVIIAVSGIDGDRRCPGILQRSERIALAGVGHGKRDDAARTGPQLARSASARFRLRHPLHRCMMAVGEELPETPRRLGNGIGIGNGAGVEAELLRLFAEAGLQTRGRLLRQLRRV
jgi:hypothetical protein